MYLCIYVSMYLCIYVCFSAVGCFGTLSHRAVPWLRILFLEPPLSVCRSRSASQNICKYGWMDGWMDVRTYVRMYACMY